MHDVNLMASTSANNILQYMDAMRRTMDLDCFGTSETFMADLGSAERGGPSGAAIATVKCKLLEMQLLKEVSKVGSA